MDEKQGEGVNNQAIAPARETRLPAQVKEGTFTSSDPRPTTACTTSGRRSYCSPTTACIQVPFTTSPCEAGTFFGASGCFRIKRLSPMLSKFSGASFFRDGLSVRPRQPFIHPSSYMWWLSVHAPHTLANSGPSAPPSTSSRAAQSIRQALLTRLCCEGGFTAAASCQCKRIYRGQSLWLMPGSGAANLQREICLWLLNVAQAVRR